MNEHYYYLILNLACIGFPFLLSFDKKVAFHKGFKAFFPACTIVALVFLVWDGVFTQQGIWGFNPEYLTGIRVVNLPLEECLFFFTIPYACVFTYCVLKTWLPAFHSGKLTSPISYVLLLLLFAFAMFFFDHLYTFVTCLLLFITIALHQFKWKKSYFKYFYSSFLVLIIPFLTCNGILTGLDFYNYPVLNFNPESISDQIVWYNNQHNLGVRVFSVPLDDFFYGALLILWNISLFEYFKEKQVQTQH
ncbi:MAG: lycopene cyclase domain-containing protein [Flavobacteriales bacterium]